MITIPLIGWVANLGNNRAILPSFSVTKYGPQCSTDPYDSDAGNGLMPDCNTAITGNDPHDSYLKDTSERAEMGRAPRQEMGRCRQRGRALLSDGQRTQHLVLNPPRLSSRLGRTPPNTATRCWRNRRASNPSIRMRRLWPRRNGDGKPISTAATISNTRRSTAIRSGRTTRKSNTGWTTSHGSSPNGRRMAIRVDVVSVHFYPQGGEDSDDTSEATQLLRNRSTRQLWDKNYVSESWIDAPVYLIPRMQQWVRKYYYGEHRPRSPNTTGARKITSTAPPLRPTSMASSGAKASVWLRAGPRPIQTRRPSRRCRCTGITTARFDLRRHQRFGESTQLRTISPPLRLCAAAMAR